MNDHAPLGAFRAPMDTRIRSPDGRSRELVRLAVLAANSHNTQPWRFELSPDRIVLHADHRRRCLAVDPDDHHLYVSLGCATENIVIAATGFGLVAVPRITEEGTVIEIDLKTGTADPSPLIAAIPLRQSTRNRYDARPLTDAEKDAVIQAATASRVTVCLVDAPEEIASLCEAVVAGNADQMADPAFVSELMHWIRFSPHEARTRRDGLFGRCLGNPGLPEWMGRLVFPLVYRVRPESAKIRGDIASASALMIFVSHADTPENWIETGRAFQRFALEATSLGLVMAHINQAVEVPVQRKRVARLITIPEGRPSLLVRIGHGERLPYAYRRDVDDVITTAEQWS
ncbi:Acg family FMN-binding oxidoreductase [Roseovarius sp. S4756]|uniref:Acg family FMN-binding oxidoreductase n=1 Tax=Roseovarius maritimus TaxID=3342637 RepID=UPI0037269909